MIDFSIDDETRMAAQTAAAFAVEHLRSRHRANEDAGLVDAEVREGFEKAGLHLLGAPADSGGLGLGMLARVRVLEELGWGDAGAALGLLAPAWAAETARGLGIGDARGAPSGVHGAASLDEIAGGLEWFPAAGPGPWLLFDGTGRWRWMSGRAEPARGLGLLASAPRRVRFENTVAEGQADIPAASRAFAVLRLGVAALAVGVARASLEHAMRYVQERVAFGKRLADHQGVAFLIAEGAMRVEAARALLMKAAHRLDGGATEDAAFAYLECAEAALWMTDHGVQLLGGHGYLKDHPVEKWMRDARALTLLAGGVDAARRDAGAEVWSGGWS